jgi:hypothetical protein
MVSILVVIMLINTRTCDGILSLLYYSQDSVIQINRNNKSIPYAYDDEHGRNSRELELIK